MKFLALLAIAALTAAQNIHIRRPRPGASLDRSSVFPVIVQTPTNGTKLQEISLVISILPCSGPNGACPNAGNNLGTILYAGAFQPRNTTGTTPEQAFNITIPASFPIGPAELLATHFVLTGDNRSPVLQIAGEIVYVDTD